MTPVMRARRSTVESLLEWSLRTSASWQASVRTRHMRGVLAPSGDGFERSVVMACTSVYEGVIALTDDDGVVRPDYVLTPGLLSIIDGARTLLDGDCGRLDCGTVSHWLDEMQSTLNKEMS